MFQEAESIMFEINKKPEEPKISKHLAAIRKRKRDALEKLGRKGVQRSNQKQLTEISEEPSGNNSD